MLFLVSSVYIIFVFDKWRFLKKPIQYCLTKIHQSYLWRKYYLLENKKFFASDLQKFQSSLLKECGFYCFGNTTFTLLQIFTDLWQIRKSFNVSKDNVTFFMLQVVSDWIQSLKEVVKIKYRSVIRNATCFEY